MALPGSSPKAAGGETWLGPANPEQELTVTVYLRRPASFQSGENLTREQAEAALSASPADLDAVRSFAEQYGLQIVAESPGARTVRLRGTVQQLDAAFGVQIGTAENASGNHYLTYRGPITVPASLSEAVTAILGLDQRPVARPRDTSPQ
jgi:kumamolisin